MQRNILYAPWRSDYISKKNTSSNDDISDNNCCVFCQTIASTEDEKNFILRRLNHTVAMLNLYPYNAGHILLLPLTHCAYPHELKKEVYSELMELTRLSIPLIQNELAAEGINVGINLGKAAGAGIPDHLHIHILPRWTGDTNFLPTLAETKHISFDMKKIYNTLKPAFDNLTI